MSTEVWSVDDYRAFIAKGLQKGKQPTKKQSTKGKDQLKLIGLQLRQEGYMVVYELAFHDLRRWRFDMALPAYKIAVEYEGINGKQSRHTSIKGYTGDTEKYNEAALLGWMVIRKTALNVSGLYNDVKKAIEARKKENT
jgi:hypothetical protein